MKKLFSLFLLLLLPLSFINAASVFSNPSSGLFGDIWVNGTNENITWTYSSTYGSSAKLLLFRNTGGGNVLIKTFSSVTNTSASHSYNWTVDAPAGSGYKLAICPTMAQAPDYRDCGYSGNLTIKGAPTETPTSTITPTLTVSPSTIQPGGSATLNWNCSPAEKCYCLGSLIGGTGQLASVGTKSVFSTQTTTYTLQCRDKTITNASYVSETATLTVSSDPITPSVKIVLKANDVDQDITIKAGTAVKLSWQKERVGSNNTYFTSCRIDSQPRDPSWDSPQEGAIGYRLVSPATTTNYSIICWDSAETNYTDDLKVTVENPAIEIPPPVIVSTSKDTDKDGILDKDDKCPNTVSGTKVATNGCPTQLFGGYICNTTTKKCEYTRKSGELSKICSASCGKEPVVPVEEPTIPTSACKDKEIPFAQISSSLKNFQYTKITENSFAEWSKTDNLDSVFWSGGSGSGDKMDIQNEMSTIQTCYANTFDDILPGDKMPTNTFIKMRDKIKSYTNKGNVIPISYQIYARGFFGGTYKIKFMGAHSVVALKVKDESTFLTQKFILEVIDPNSFAKDTLTCKVESLYQKPLSRTDTAVVTICHSQNLLSQIPILRETAGVGADIFLMIYDEAVLNLGAEAAPLIESRQKICQANPSLGLCKKTPVERLSNDYPQIDNTGDAANPRGFCKGWSLFSLRVAYLGDFVGECHPVAVKSPTQNFLASLGAVTVTPFSNLVDFTQTLFNWSLSFFR